MADKDEGGPAGTPLLEWVASSIGATFALGLIGFLTFDGMTAATPPDVSVHPGVVQAHAGLRAYDRGAEQRRLDSG
jgi:hypothetical protein